MAGSRWRSEPAAVWLSRLPLWRRRRAAGFSALFGWWPRSRACSYGVRRMARMGGADVSDACLGAVQSLRAVRFVGREGNSDESFLTPERFLSEVWIVVTPARYGRRR